MLNWRQIVYFCAVASSVVSLFSLRKLIPRHLQVGTKGCGILEKKVVMNCPFSIIK